MVSALIAIQDGSGAIENQGQGYIQQLDPGDVATFTLQSTSGILPTWRWEVDMQSPDTPSLNLTLTWSPNNNGIAPAFPINLPPHGFTARYNTTIFDANQNALSTFTGEIFGGETGGGNSIPLFASNLALTHPAGSGREVIYVDGYAAVGDGGQGNFFWDSTYAGTDSPLTRVVTGVSPGAWIRDIGPHHTMTAAMFGAKGDCSSFSGGAVVTGTPDEVPVQAMLDFNQPGATLPGAITALNAKLNATTTLFNNQTVGNVTGYRLRCPVEFNDNKFGSGNVTVIFDGEPGAQSGPVALDFLGPAIVAGVNGGTNRPEPTLDPSGSGEWVQPIGLNNVSSSITIASGSNNVPLPTGTIHVSSTTTVVQPAGKFAIIIGGVAQIIKYTGISGNSFTGCTGGTGTMLTGQQVVFPSTPQWNLGDSPTLNDLTGISSFTWEYFVNPGNFRAYLTSLGGSLNASHFGCEGAIGDTADPVLHHQSFIEKWLDIGSGLYIEFTLVTTTNTYNVFSSFSADHGPADNTLSHIAVVYNHATQTLDLYINGAQPDSSMHATGLTGSLDQRWYESITVGAGQNYQFPIQGTNLITITPVLLGRHRLSTTARYTSTFTAPTPSSVTCDGNTRYFMDFDPSTVKTFPSGWQSPSVPTRPGLQGYNIAQSGTNRIGSFSSGVGFPCWMLNRSYSTQYAGNARVRNMLIFGWGEGIHSYSMVNGEFGEDCKFVGLENGIIFDAFSYASGVGPGAQFNQCGNGTATRGMSAEVYFASGSQFAYTKERYASAFGGCNFGIVGVFGDIELASGFMSTYRQAPLAFLQNPLNVNCKISVLDDGGNYGLCAVLWAPNQGFGGSRLVYSGGSLGIDISTVPVFLVGAYDAPLEIFVSVLGSSKNPLVSFQGRAAAGLGNPVVPVIVHGKSPNLSGFIDPSNPGPVQVVPNINTVFTFAPSANAAVVLESSGYTGPIIGDSFYRYYVIGTGGWTATQPVSWVANPSAVYVVHNTNGQTASLKRVGSSSPVSLGSGNTITVRDNGTDLVAL